MDKIVEEGLLYDFYGPLLTGRQREIYEKVVYEDLTLGEIAQAEGISRQAVHDMISRSTRIMRAYEEKLGMIERFAAVRAQADELDACCRDETDPEILKEKITAIARMIRKDSF
ncbi:MAG: DNA-binding protein [Lachnospiraceae bacterium]|nr:DNA-binding protein [Lachnospiraceae bacterium]